MEYAILGGMIGCFIMGYVVGRCRPPHERDLINLHQEVETRQQTLETTILQRMHEQLHRVFLWGETFHQSFRIHAYDGDPQVTCLICYDAIHTTHSVIACKTCQQCVGHALCVIRWLQHQPSCPTCRTVMTP